MVKLPLKDEEKDDKNENRTQQIEKKIKKIKWEFQKNEIKKNNLYTANAFFTRIVCIYLYKENPQN